ncbi:MAG TPA: GTPase ObgE [Dehalococcoidia bacterium]|nr:GTPase ObgE [Dehalococcoidia bacterium]
MIDEVEIRVKAGDGGNGAVSFRREKFVPRGGPDGGDGANGGSVILQADPSINSLAAFRRRRVLRAENGQSGRGRKQHGRRGADLVVTVPLGTQVFRQTEEMAYELVSDLNQPAEQVLVARGGQGGRGNARFATSTNQAPRIAQRGSKGEEVTLKLSLKLLADVGLVGAPNAGKSTLLAAISAAHPKIAPYPFTTLEPELGVVELDYDAFVVADIPGLIEGASRGAGLGLDFLRHIERTRVLVHVLAADAEEALATFHAVNAELAAFDERLGRKPQIVALNKMDMPAAQARAPELEENLRSLGFDVHHISAAAGDGLDDLVRAMHTALQRQASLGEEAEAREVPIPTLRPSPPPGRFRVYRDDGRFVVEGRQPVRLVETMDVDDPEAWAVVLRRLTRMGVVAGLRRAGVRAGDTVRFGEKELRWEG